MRRDVARGLVLSALVVTIVMWSLVAARAATSGSARPALVFALLMDNRLLAVRVDNGVVAALRTLAPPPRPTALILAGHYLALGPDGQTLYALTPGDPAHLAIVDVATARIRARYALPSGVLARSLAVGSTTGKIYVFGNLPGPQTIPLGTHVEGVVVLVLDPRSGSLLGRWVARRADGHDWLVYQGAVSRDERHLFISYHGPDTTGIDRFALGLGGLRRCQSAPFPSPRAGVGCLPTHGGFVLYGDEVLASTGTPVVLEMKQSGRIVRHLDTRLLGNHLMEFAVDEKRAYLTAVGPCGYTGGMSVLAIATGQVRVLSAPRVSNTICGERFSPGPTPLLIVGRTTATVPLQGIPGALLFLDTRTGQIRRTVATPAEPIDVAGGR